MPGIKGSVMGKIIYGVCGEGLGHATRVMTIVNELKFQHEFLIFAARDAYRYLKQNLARSDAIRLEAIPGLNFRYCCRRISYILSLANALPFVLRMQANVREMRSQAEDFGGDLAITDFEPLTARLARQLDLPLVSIDHQHFISELDFASLPWGWRSRARLMSYFVNRHYDWQAKTIISSFFNQCLTSNDRVRHVGVSIRRGLSCQIPRNDSYLLVYLRRFHSQHLFRLLQNRSERFVIYGHHPQGEVGNLQFKQIDNFSFCRDLANCRGLICNAGNQLVGEALSFGKPVLAIPEPGNFEQQLNGYFLNQLGGGLSVPCWQLDQDTLDKYIDSIPDLRQQINRESVVGNESIIQEIQSYFSSQVPQQSSYPVPIPVSA